MVEIWSERVVGGAAVDRWSTVVQSERRLLHASSDHGRLQLFRDRINSARSETVPVDGGRALGDATVAKLVLENHRLANLPHAVSWRFNV